MKLAPRHNAVPWDPPGLTIALQYWEGDAAQALRLARLLADIETKHRDDVSLLFCRRGLDLSPEAWDTLVYCGAKFSVSHMATERKGEGHPAGCNALWAGTTDWVARAWAAGIMRQGSVFFVEADGCPLRPDWIDLLAAEQQVSILAGKRVTGALTRFPAPHFNGGLIMHASVWLDRPSLHETPPAEAWDIQHAAALLAEGRATQLIKNTYGAEGWSDQVLDSLAAETAWLSNSKDLTAIEWAERTLVAK